jgi:hypothetical protein
MRAVAVAITSSAVVGPLVASLMGSNRMEASEGESAEMTKLAGMLGEFNSMSTGKVLLVSRFGRARMDRACTWRASHNSSAAIRPRNTPSGSHP